MCELFKIPILFLVFNRPKETLLVFERIREIRPKYLYIAADGARNYHENDIINCREVKKIVNKIDWDCELKTLYRQENLGCKLAVSSAINWFFNQVEEGIILEDDCYPDLSFFLFCEQLLKYYKNDSKIMLIGGNNFHNTVSSCSYYFSRYPHIWGWATWKRAWEKYQLEVQHNSEQIRTVIHYVFKNHSERKHWTKLMEKVRNNEINTWDYQWTYSIWKNDGIVITPAVNLVRNLGFDDNSTHTSLIDKSISFLVEQKMSFPLKHPATFDVDIISDGCTYKNNFHYSLIKRFQIIRSNGFFKYLKHLITRLLK